VIVIEIASNTKAHHVSLVQDACHFPNTLNSHLHTAPNWRENENLNPNIRSHGWAHAAVNERSVKRNVGCKATSGALAAFVPVEDDRELELVSRSGPPVPIKPNNIRGFVTNLHRNPLHTVVKIRHTLARNKPPNV
jgi:hypothetical protein